MNDSAMAVSVPREELVERLLELQARMRQRVDSVLPRGLLATMSTELSGVTLHQLEVLRTLAGRGRVTMHELAALLGVGPSSATQLVDRLISRGLVERPPTLATAAWSGSSPPPAPTWSRRSSAS
jgi:DNA-binding MarR family transcriptional regulator